MVELLSVQYSKKQQRIKMFYKSREWAKEEDEYQTNGENFEW